MSQLLIIDGHAYAYRAFYAIRELRAADGQPTNAIYGFIKMVEKMRLALQPTHLIVVWDGGLNAERMALLPEYKANRAETPADLRPQFDQIRDYLAAAGFADLQVEGVEADDYIGCLARHAAGAGWRVVIASSDKDFMQLVSEHVGLLNPNDKSGTIWGAVQVRAKSGVEPEQVPDWLALMGDTVDNIAGVPGVGPKTAAELLKQFGSVNGLLERLSEVKSEKLRASLSAAAERVRRNLTMVRLLAVPCEFVPEKLAPQPANYGQLRNLFQRWSFNGMLAELETRMPEQQAELI